MDPFHNCADLRSIHLYDVNSYCDAMRLCLPESVLEERISDLRSLVVTLM